MGRQQRHDAQGGYGFTAAGLPHNSQSIVFINAEIDLFNNYFILNENTAGGKAYYIPVPHTGILRNVLNDTNPVWDVRIECESDLTGGNFSYIHKKISDKDIYFFANSSDTDLDIPAIVRGKKKLSRWDPHTGEIRRCRSETIGNPEYITRFNLKLQPVSSVFYISR